MSTSEPAGIVRHAGALRLCVRPKGRESAPAHGAFRQTYSYRITGTTNPDREPIEGTDLRSGVGDPPDVEAMVRTLASFLGAAAEAYEYTMRHPDTPSENLGLFPSWVPEAAYENSEELALLAEGHGPDDADDLDHALGATSEQAAARMRLFEQWEDLPEPAEDPELAFMMVTERSDAEEPWPPGRYFEVVFAQDSDGYAVCDLIEEQGVDAAIEYLAQWDYGQETVDAAVSNGQVHHEIPSFQGDRSATSGPYTIVYNLGLGHASLYKEFTSGDRPAASPSITRDGPAPKPRTILPPLQPPDGAPGPTGPAL